MTTTLDLKNKHFSLVSLFPVKLTYTWSGERKGPRGVK